MKIKRFLTNLLLLFGPFLIQAVVTSTSSIFLNTDSELKLDQSLALKRKKRKEIRQKHIDSNAPEFVNHINSAFESIENYTTYGEEKKAEIRKWLTEEYVNLPEFNLTEHRLNILEKCVYVNPNNAD